MTCKLAEIDFAFYWITAMRQHFFTNALAVKYLLEQKSRTVTLAKKSQLYKIQGSVAKSDRKDQPFYSKIRIDLRQCHNKEWTHSS